MYFWKINCLKQSLKKEPLSEKESIKYIVATVVLYCLFLIINPAKTDKWYLISYLIYMIITVIGIIYCFHKNGGIQGNNFLKKFISLNWVLGIRLFILLDFNA